MPGQSAEQRRRADHNVPSRAEQSRPARNGAAECAAAAGPERDDADNLRFRRHLKARHIALLPLQTLASRIAESVDCTKCANCCRQMVVNVSDSEIQRIAEYLGMDAGEVTRLYTEPEPLEPAQGTRHHSHDASPAGSSSHPPSKILLNRNDACVFLHQNLCMIYPARPRACQDFPHVRPGMHTLGSRVESLCRHASLCPILAEALETYKHVVGYRREKACAGKGG